MTHITSSCGTTETPSLLVLNDVRYSCLPTDKPNQYTCEKIAISEGAYQVFNDYHEVVTQLTEIGCWVENRAHINGAFKVYQGKYELTVSSIYIAKHTTQTFTLELLLDDNYVPASLQLRTTNLTKNPSDSDVSIAALKLPHEYQGGATEVAVIVNSILIAAMKKIDDSKEADTSNNKLNVEDYWSLEREEGYNMEVITNNMLPVAGEKARDVRLVGFSLDKSQPAFYVGYTTDDGLGVTELYVNDYFAAKHAANTSCC